MSYATRSHATAAEGLPLPLHWEVEIEVTAEHRVPEARRRAKAVAAELGFPTPRLYEIATSVTELATNLVLYAKAGHIAVGKVDAGQRRGLVLRSLDQGPGIASVEKALQDSYSTGGGLGSGLPAVRRLMDDFSLTSTLGEGTLILAWKWLPCPPPR
jgi:serine/threonine-protein kinase RsbT